MTDLKHKRRDKGHTKSRNPAFLGALDRLSETNLLVSTLYALLFLFQLWVFPLLVGWLGQIGWWWVAAPLGILLFIWQGSRLRALENLVHDASHFNWYRSDKTLNDILATLMVVAPVMQVIGLYRRMHSMHHSLFGSPADPCMQRAITMGKITRGNPLPTRLLAVAGIFFELSADYYRTQFDHRSYGPLAFIAWHLVVVVAPYCLIMGVTDGLGLYVTFWLLPFMISLPVIRALAESEEHDYGRDGSELEVTFTNDGTLWRHLVHPAGDAWHAAHHVRMTVPAWKVRHLHILLRNDMPEYRDTLGK